jgi:hypothetical protein
MSTDPQVVTAYVSSHVLKPLREVWYILPNIDDAQVAYSLLRAWIGGSATRATFVCYRAPCLCLGSKHSDHFLRASTSRFEIQASAEASIDLWACNTASGLPRRGSADPQHVQLACQANVAPLTFVAGVAVIERKLSAGPLLDLSFDNLIVELDAGDRSPHSSGSSIPERSSLTTSARGSFRLVAKCIDAISIELFALRSSATIELPAWASSVKSSLTE